MGRQERLMALLRARFPDAEIELWDDSAAHEGHLHSGGETHFRLRIRSRAFHGLSRIAIHRAVMDAVRPEFATGLHSLVIEQAEARGER
ncbi:MAG: BolA family transcriptional regulator [Turneriella sp.]|nr:BolA family transcriptional regulator [Leptospiraceae bacterium]MCX7631933.1 BolA family transcriptional regulator [Turneriella sp.]